MVDGIRRTGVFSVKGVREEYPEEGGKRSSDAKRVEQARLKILG